jgi:hypothetical protein
VADDARQWDGAQVRAWLESRIVAARADQVAAERHGRGYQDDCDKAAAEEMVCSLLKSKAAAEDQAEFTAELKRLMGRDVYVWRGVYDDTRFDRHVKAYIRKLLKMTKQNTGFENRLRYQ